MNIFDILGPVMVGPSSSHTAGAVKIGLIARELLKDTPVSADIFLHGSFSSTGIGHGTDRALVAGLLGMHPDDSRIPDSFEYASHAGLQFKFMSKMIKDVHPNTALLCLTGKNGNKTEVQASSVGGGRIMINKLDGDNVNFTSEKPTLIVSNQDKPGLAAEVTSVLAENYLNIATMQLCRNKRGGYAVMIMETDQAIPEESVRRLEQKEGIIKVTYINVNY